ncbi:MAG: phosphoribosylglycinamide formyltransferase, partial [Burkholderiaceae bacterium]
SAHRARDPTRAECREKLSFGVMSAMQNAVEYTVASRVISMRVSTIRAVKKRNIVVLASGRGSNLQALLATASAERWDTKLDAHVAAVVCNRADAQVLDVAHERGIPTAVVAHQQFASRDEFDAALAAAVDDHDPSLVVLAGFMRVLAPSFVRRHQERLINIHPSLLPAFPGLNTHRRALEAGVRVHGATVHFVSDDVDAGPIIAQAAVPVYVGDDEATLAARVLQQEHRLLPRVVRQLLEGKVRYGARRAVLNGVAPDELSLLVA